MHLPSMRRARPCLRRRLCRWALHPDTSLEAQRLSPPLPALQQGLGLQEAVLELPRLPCALSLLPEAFSSPRLLLPSGRERCLDTGSQEKLKVEKPRPAGCTLPSLSLISGRVAGGIRNTHYRPTGMKPKPCTCSEHDASCRPDYFKQTPAMNTCSF